MSTPTPETQSVNEAPQGLPPLPLWRVLAMAAAFLAIIAFSIWHIGNLRERAWDARAETLTEKYGVTIESIDPPLRDGEPVTWRIDGVKRECLLSRETDTLRCEDETGALVDVGK